MPKIRGVKPDYWTDEDIVELSIPARLLFIGLWNYACDNGHLQDKPKQIKMRVLPGDDVNATELLRELEDKGRIRRGGGWITVPNLTEHQKPDLRYFTTCDKPGCDDPPEKVSQRNSRRAHTVRTASAQGVPDVGTAGAHVDGDGDGDGEMMVITSPTTALAVVPTSEPDNFRLDIVAVCEHLANRIEANGAKRPAITKAWLDAARLMIDRDNRTEHEIHGAIDWCQADDFWRANILSMPKLRAKYDQLRLQAQRKNGTTNRQAETDGIFARSAARMGVQWNGEIS